MDTSQTGVLYVLGGHGRKRGLTLGCSEAIKLSQFYRFGRHSGGNSTWVVGMLDRCDEMYSINIIRKLKKGYGGKNFKYYVLFSLKIN